MKKILKTGMAVATATWLTGACAMKRTRSATIALALFICVLEAVNSLATVRYVDVNSTNGTPPYTNWVAAATNIQDAVDVAAAADEIVVTNGVYQTGAQAVYGMSNRLAVTKAVVVRSVNGPAMTSIVGSGPNGTNAVRCVYMTDRAVLAGFTLTNGATQTSDAWWTNRSVGGGICCESTNAVVTNCVLTGNSAYYEGGGAYSGTLNNCMLISNSVAWGQGGGAAGGTLNNCALTGNFAILTGGGAFLGALNDCTVTDNSAGSGGGAAGDKGGGICTLNHCTLTGNSAYGGSGACYCTLNNCMIISNSTAGGEGGGAYKSTLTNCMLIGNSVTDGAGGGAYLSTLDNCMLIGNSTTGGEGGGAYLSMLNNCTLTGNLAGASGGAYGGTLDNCTLIGNTAFNSGGGAFDSALNNCIVYYNTAPDGPNTYNCALKYCCTTPKPTSGPGNFTNPPRFVDTNGWSNLRLQTNSPCINAGTNAYAPGTTDLDGRPRVVGGTVDVGAYEFQGAGMGEFLGWLQQYGLATDGSADYADSDADGLNNWQEWRCGTCPTNAASVLMVNAPTQGTPGWNVTWQSANTRTYYLQRSTNLSAPPAFSTIQSNILGQAGTTTYADTNAIGPGPFFYRVGVQSP